MKASLRGIELAPACTNINVVVDDTINYTLYFSHCRGHEDQHISAGTHHMGYTDLRCSKICLSDQYNKLEILGASFSAYELGNGCEKPSHGL